MKTANSLGIDLGTTYSCVAIIDEYGNPVVLKNIEGCNSTPSVIHFDGFESISVGAVAKNLATAYPETTVSFIKRHMTNDASFNKPPIFPNGLDPVEISALLLKKLVADANAAIHSDYDIKNVVITCPAYFDAKARQRTEQAGIIAGLNVLRIINEPTAAAIAYGIRQHEDQTVLVYDLGGGTFDVTILKIAGNDYEVIATGGDPLLGGYDWDKELANHILAEYNKRYGTNYVMPMTEDAAANADSKTKKMRTSLLAEAERIKKALSSSNKGIAKSAWLFEEDGHSLSPAFEISRDDFDNITIDLLDSTIEKTKDVIQYAIESKKIEHIDKIILVGGSSKMQQVTARITAEFNTSPLLLDPDECVAKGAAMFAYSIEEQNYSKSMYRPGSAEKASLQIKDVCSKTYGIGIVDDMVANFIFANTPLPITVTRTHHTVCDNTTYNTLWVYESESQENKISRSWAELVNQEGKIVFKRPVSKGYEYTITLFLDNDGLLKISANSPDGAHVEFELSIKGVKDSAEIQKSKNIVDKAIFDQ